MKLTIAKSDLDSALTLTGYALGKEAEWTKHFHIRTNDNGGVEFHTTNHRHGASTAINSVTIGDDDANKTFTLESSRIKQVLQYDDGNSVMVFDTDENVVKLKTARGVLSMVINKNTFPYWDDALSEAKDMLTIESKNLAQVITHHKYFIDKPDAKSMMYRYIAFKNGGVLSGNGFSMSLTISDDLENADFYLNQLDINPLLGFLKQSDGKITIKKTDKMVFFCAEDDSVFGLVLPSKRAIAGMGTLDPKQMLGSLTDVQASWSTAKDNLTNSLGLLGCVMDETDNRVKFHFEEGSLYLSAMSLTGSVDTIEVGLKDFEDDRDVLSKPMYFNRGVFSKVLSLMDEGDISVSVLNQLNGSPVVNHTVSGYTTYSLIVPLQTANF